MPRLQQAGPDSHEVAMRLGDRLQVTPPDKPAGWTVADYTSDILRLQDSNEAADSHTFLAISVGDARLSLAPADSQTRPTAVFTLRIAVLRDVIQPLQH